MKGGVHSETPPAGNSYNQNFRNRFCGCSEIYDADNEKGTMYQCLGLGGGCGEDWWHPECIVGLLRKWYKDAEKGALDQQKPAADVNSPDDRAPGLEEPLQPPGFPHEDDFDAFLCYKCVEANPWIKRYAGADGFLPAVYYKSASTEVADMEDSQQEKATKDPSSPTSGETTSRKRKADSEVEDQDQTLVAKKPKNETTNNHDPPPATPNCRYATLPPPPTGKLSLFLKEDFREHLCHCPTCFPPLAAHPQLLEEEEVYEPPLSESGDADGPAGGSVGTGSLLERGEAALSNMDRVRAIGKSPIITRQQETRLFVLRLTAGGGGGIEGVMVYNHLKDKVKSFLQPFAESGQAVGAEDIKAYFEKLRGDAEAIRAAGGAAAGDGGGDGSGDNRREQSGRALRQSLMGLRC